jgi:hypothetical protein
MRVLPVKKSFSPRRIYACQTQSKVQLHHRRPEGQRDFQDREINGKNSSLIF